MCLLFLQLLGLTVGALPPSRPGQFEDLWIEGSWISGGGNSH